MKKLLLALAGVAIAASALAELSKHKDWDKSPEAYFLTPPERSEWKKVATDEDAEKFIALYWAKRGGDTFKQEVSRRIAAADQQFRMARYKRGADSVRGRLLVVLGPPSRVSQQRAQEVSGQGASLDTRFSGADEPIAYTWTYEKEKLAPFGLPELRAQVTVDPRRGADSLENTTDVERAIAVVAAKSVVNPNATLVSVPAAAPVPASGPRPAPAAAPPAAPGAAGTATVALPAAVKAALQAASGKSGGDAGFWSGTFRGGSGDPFLAIQFYLPSNKPAFSAGAPLKVGGLVTNEGGQEAESFWEDAVFSELTEGSRKDRVLDRSIVLPPGSYKGIFGLFGAEGQPAVASSTVTFKLAPRSSDFEVSPLILSSALFPLTKRPGPNDPFVFGMEKPIKVEPKGDRLFSKQDSLWYFYEVANPTLTASAATTNPPPAPMSTPAAGAPAAPTPAAEAPKPRVMNDLSVLRDGKDAFRPQTLPADLSPTSPGHYGGGNEIPLASFEPGYYTFKIRVRDLNASRDSAAFKGFQLSEDFTVLMPDGTLPAKPTTAPPATPKPKKP